MNDLDELCVNTLRFLAVDAVERARSGHPGMPLGAAPMTYVLWDRFLKHNPGNPGWWNRDRFILSAGHGSALLYALLHVYGYPMSLEDLKGFRQYGTKTPGHPEYNPQLGIEATTGPLGQGFAMGLGMALAERFLSNCFNAPNLSVVDHYTYGIVSDGDLMEGVASEAASLAGFLGLGKLIYLYDDNHISIEGTTDLAFTEDVKRRMEAYDWQVLVVEDGNDLEAIAGAIRWARGERTKPSLIMVRTHIGYGSPKQDSPEAHGEPLGPEATRATKERLGWPPGKEFYVPPEALDHFRETALRGAREEASWRRVLDRYRSEQSDLAGDFEGAMGGVLPDDLEGSLPIFSAPEGAQATRTASGLAMNALVKRLPHRIAGGSGDLAPSTKTTIVGGGDLAPAPKSIQMGYGDLGLSVYCSHNIHFGVREHAMGAIVNGMALHGGLIPYGATFLTFSDYMRPALRLSALMGTPSIFIFTHDSIGLGEDGPTHQPVEHLMSLRAIPGMTVLRPADANETAAAWGIAMRRRRPVSLILTRQKLPVLDPGIHPCLEGPKRGAYVLSDAEGGETKVIIIATGSEVHLALGAREELARRGVGCRVVSMPSWEIFDEQPQEYRDEVLPRGVPKLAVEAGSTLGWCRYVGDEGGAVGLDRFGASGPGEVVMERLGFSVENVVERALELVGRRCE